MPHADAITDFIKATNGSDPDSRLKQMGSLSRAGIKPHQFSLFCQGFAEGMRYVEQRFGTVPKAVVISDEESDSPRYNLDAETIYLPRKFIHLLIGNVFTRQSKTAPFDLNYCQAAKMYGVEEAFHHYQYKRNPEQQVALLKAQNVPPGTAAYDDQPIEKEAKAVVREAMRDFGFLPVSAAGVTFAMTARNSSSAFGLAI